MPAAARLYDNHTCPMLNPDESPHTGGPITSGESTVRIGNESAARIGDSAACIGPPDSILTGAMMVSIGNQPAARVDDQTVHGGVIFQGENTVQIGDPTAGAGGSTGATMRAARAEGRPLIYLGTLIDGTPIFGREGDYVYTPGTLIDGTPVVHRTLRPFMID